MIATQKEEMVVELLWLFGRHNTGINITSDNVSNDREDDTT